MIDTYVSIVKLEKIHLNRVMNKSFKIYFRVDTLLCMYGDMHIVHTMLAV